MWLYPFRSFKSLVPVCLSGSPVESITAVAFGHWADAVVPLFQRGWMGRSNTWLGCVALYLPCNASVHGTSTHQHDRQKINLLLCLFCSSLHRALLFVPATRGWHGLLLNLFRARIGSVNAKSSILLLCMPGFVHGYFVIFTRVELRTYCRLQQTEMYSLDVCTGAGP